MLNPGQQRVDNSRSRHRWATARGETSRSDAFCPRQISSVHRIASAVGSSGTRVSRDDGLIGGTFESGSVRTFMRVTARPLSVSLSNNETTMSESVARRVDPARICRACYPFPISDIA